MGGWIALRNAVVCVTRNGWQRKRVVKLPPSILNTWRSWGKWLCLQRRWAGPAPEGRAYLHIYCKGWKKDQRLPAQRRQAQSSVSFQCFWRLFGLNPCCFTDSEILALFKKNAKDTFLFTWRETIKYGPLRNSFSDWFLKCFVPEVKLYLNWKNHEFKMSLIPDTAPTDKSAIVNADPRVPVISIPPGTTPLLHPVHLGVLKIVHDVLDLAYIWFPRRSDERDPGTYCESSLAKFLHL